VEWRDAHLAVVIKLRPCKMMSIVRRGYPVSVAGDSAFSVRPLAIPAVQDRAAKVFGKQK